MYTNECTPIADFDMRYAFINNVHSSDNVFLRTEEFGIYFYRTSCPTKVCRVVCTMSKQQQNGLLDVPWTCTYCITAQCGTVDGGFNLLKRSMRLLCRTVCFYIYTHFKVVSRLRNTCSIARAVRATTSPLQYNHNDGDGGYRYRFKRTQPG
jgi:hypothetical protein